MVEIIPKSRKKYPLWLHILFYGAIGAMLISVLSLALLFYLEGRAVATLGDFEDKLAKGKTAEEQKLEDDISRYRKKISDFSLLVAERVNPVSGLLLLEDTVHPEVVFGSMSLTPLAGTMHLFGEAVSFRSLEQQMRVLALREELERVELSSIGLGEQGQVNFQLKLDFSSGFFK